MSDIDRDALIAGAAQEVALRSRLLFDDAVIAARIAVDAILPAVTQAIRAAEQRGREQAAQAIEAAISEHDVRYFWADVDSMYLAVRLARGGATDEEQA